MWQNIWYHGDCHTVPTNDMRAHTIPVCWCKPATTKSGAGMAIMYAHNELRAAAKAKKEHG